MTRDDIIKLAREAKAVPHAKDAFGTPTAFSASVEDLERFAALVANHEREQCSNHYLAIMRKAIEEEREACARVCEELEAGFRHRLYREDFAAAIRARGNL